MVVKAWPPEPLVYAAIVAVLLGYRLVAARYRQAPRGRQGAWQGGKVPAGSGHG